MTDLRTTLLEAVEFCLNEDNDWKDCREVLRNARKAVLADVEARAPHQQAVIAELAAHIQTARRALADPRTERSILSAGVALDEAFQVLEGRATQEPPVDDVDIQLLAWAVSNCHTLARRRLRANSPDAEWWQHVLCFVSAKRLARHRKACCAHRCRPS